MIETFPTTEKQQLLAVLDWLVLFVLGSYVLLPPVVVLVATYLQHGHITMTTKWVAVAAALPFSGALISNIRSRCRLVRSERGFLVTEPGDFEFVGGIRQYEIQHSSIEDLWLATLPNQHRRAASWDAIGITLVSGERRSTSGIITLGDAGWKWTAAGQQFLATLQSTRHPDRVSDM